MAEKGKNADRPAEIPKKGWLQIAKRVKEQIASDHVTIIAAGVAFYLFLSIFPSLVAIVSIYGLVYTPGEVEQQMLNITSVLPEETHQVLSERLKALTQTSSETLGWSLVLSILISLWSANSGTKSLFEGVNIAYNLENERNFFQENGLTLLFTIGGMIFGIVCISLIVAFPAIVDSLPLPQTIKTIIGWGRWLLLALAIIFSLAMIFKFAPYRHNPTSRWISWGSVTGALLWIIGSWAFSYYIKNFADYNETYGSAAAVVILMLWFNLTSFIILLGAEINSEVELQTARDTTTGREKPMGERGAYHADHVADR